MGATSQCKHHVISNEKIMLLFLAEPHASVIELQSPRGFLPDLGGTNYSRWIYSITIGPLSSIDEVQ